MTGLIAERLREVLHYDPVTGIFTRRVSSGGCGAGTVAGGLRDGGYWKISVDDRQYRAHRLAWLYQTGAWPDYSEDIDHRNGVRHDNRWQNLRLADRTQNNGNMRIPKTNTSGFKGVSWHKRAGQWHAHIQVNKKTVHLGFFGTAEEASAAYLRAAGKHFGQFARAA